SSFSKVDIYCSPGRQAAMISLLLAFMDRAEAAVQSGIAPARLAELPVVRQLQRLGEEYGEGDVRKLSQLPHQLDYEFDALHTVTANVR
ncbi:MAG: hypothetical protein NDI84_16890, partial [Steroidobacteraceae bacterium]|nr:hypothetical protein [Steroidobacteraceae bacterium]